MKQVAILGFGLEGKALFAYLRKKKGLEITILDRDPAIKISRGAKKVLGKNYLRNIGKFDLIFRSPGVPYKLPELKKVRRRISSLTKLFFEKARKVQEIVDNFSKRHHHFSDAELGMALKRAKYLTRRGKRGNYEYIQKHPYIEETKHERPKRNK